MHVTKTTQDAHTPVLIDEVIAALSPKDGDTYVDATYGRGGYTSRILEAAGCTIYGIDQDKEAGVSAQDLSKKHPNTFKFLEGNFGGLKALMGSVGVYTIQGAVFDLGVSSPQLDQAHRGFSFQKDGPLDMRLGQKGKTAADVVNTCSEEELADILFYYGEEPRARQIAKAIIKKRTEAPLKTTLELASLVHSVLGKKSGKIDSATKTFQALRIYVNDELHVLEKGLQEAEEMLEIGGRLVVVTFHSLEDRIVKKFFNDRSGKNERPSSRHQPDSTSFKSPPTFSLITRRAQKPTDEEIERNPRARSAKLRAGIRIGNENAKIFMSQEISQQGAST